MPSKNNARIFIADDDSDDRDFIISALQHDGFSGDLLEFENGEVLSRYLENHPENTPDLILLDLNMPIKNGFETLRELKSDTKFTDIPVVVLSASTKNEDKLKCIQTGCNHFLNKPLDLAGYAKIAQHVGNVFFREL